MSRQRKSMHFANCPQASPDAQRGAVLLTGLVLLFVVTLFGVSGMQTITLDERIVSNMQSATIAFHGAEGGLSACEANVQAQTGTVFSYGSFPADWRESDTFWTNAGQTATFVGQVIQPPRCVIEYIGDGAASGELNYAPTNSASSRPTYRVTSISKGADMSTEAILESVFICPGGCMTGAEVTQYGTGP
ncbi:MAG: PilX N-terminal domain-containing pilus assembly protein [Pseudomonadales bacterium]